MTASPVIPGCRCGSGPGRPIPDIRRPGPRAAFPAFPRRVQCKLVGVAKMRRRDGAKVIIALGQQKPGAASKVGCVMYARRVFSVVERVGPLVGLFVGLVLAAGWIGFLGYGIRALVGY